MAKQQRGSRRGATHGRPPAGSTPPAAQSGPARGSTRTPAPVATSPGPAGRSRAFLLWTLAAVVIGGVVIAVAVSSAPKPVSTGAPPVKPAALTPADIPSEGRTLGAADAPVTIDLYGDFRCSACYGFTFGGTEEKLVDAYVVPGDARIVWHDYLVIDLIKRETASRDAANAAWCAADQGRFWPMHDWLYANQSPTEDASAFTKARLGAIATSAGLDMATFTPCLEAGTHDAEIAAEMAATPPEVGGTPTVFVDGKRVGDPQGVPNVAEISAAVEAALARSTTQP